MLYYLNYVLLFDGTTLLSRITFSSCSTLCHTGFSFWMYLGVNDTRPTWLRIISKDSRILSPSSPPPSRSSLANSLLVPIPFFCLGGPPQLLISIITPEYGRKRQGTTTSCRLFSESLDCNYLTAYHKMNKQTDLIFYVIETNL